MDKLQAWLRRIQQPPRREVANLEYWFLLIETRIAPANYPPVESERIPVPTQGEGEEF